MSQQCRFFGEDNVQCTEEGTNKVQIGSPGTGCAIDYHFCNDHVNYAKASAKEVIANVKERQATN